MGVDNSTDSDIPKYVRPHECSSVRGEVDEALHRPIQAVGAHSTGIGTEKDRFLKCTSGMGSCMLILRER
ncbi:hypothetical protein PF005_g11213 [Phytophthora fragariae]|uniref:Uncharacterized protein n=1 Tax=Phytophthora fragariae TaxID=53985 RepID=A0A6A3S9H7_9STRA|nr:hypothetical protein PF003_g10864 [Phytophthora fragariae]KAE8937673.1 hypothetical protein PF009_g12436 [Phytophthora fragariae]KAE9006343.1 hypothetical protein PF011_g11623 [Phytophthora fragariae]KAE9112557.1 hypothetical protein PF007_g11056 [Phytophthora fragariae]KAE9127431.1 hypothetical protein PF010_g4896 [Phytophthora fragariae]